MGFFQKIIDDFGLGQHKVDEEALYAQIALFKDDLKEQEGKYTNQDEAIQFRDKWADLYKEAKAARLGKKSPYGTDKEVDGVVINDKCKALAQKVKEIIDTKSSFANWLNNQNVRNQLKLEIKICLVKNGYPPQYSPEVFKKVMEQVENFEENN